MKHMINHETVCALDKALKSIRFMPFGKKIYQHNRDVKWVKAAWQHFQQNPLGFLATSPAPISQDVLSLANPAA